MACTRRGKTSSGSVAERIYLVVAPGFVFAAYRGPRGPELAGQHSRCLLGATVVPCDLLDSLPPEIREDINTEWDADDEDDTPVIGLDDIDEEPKR